MKRTTRTSSKAVLAGLLLGTLASLGGCSSLLFYPEPGQPFTPAKAGLDYHEVSLLAADGTRLHGWWLPAKPGIAVKGTVLHLHGNGGNMAWHLGATWWLPAEGYQVLMLDYRGYGLSAGSPSLPAIYQDIDASFAWLQRQPEVAGKPLVLLGQSLGGAMAVHYLAAHPAERGRLNAVVFDGAPASYRAVGRFVLSTSWLTWPLQVPLSWLVPDGDSALYSVAQLQGMPQLYFHSVDDQVVPVNSGLALYQAAAGPKTLQLTHGGHVQTFADPKWRQSMLRFIEAATLTPSHPR